MNCCNAVVILAATAGLATMSPTTGSADETVRRKPGDELIESLQNRSAVDRWILLRRDQRKQQATSETAYKQRGTDSGYDELPTLTAPSLSKPFPEPGMNSPEAANASEPPVENLREPVRIGQRVPTPTPMPIDTSSEGPDQLRKITDIMPYHDYAPESHSNQVKSTTLPDEIWTSKPYTPRKFEDVMYTWEASDLYHNPLYFEDPALERYGHTYPDAIQPFASVGRFGLQLFGLPYQMTIDPICSKHYTLGWYRPGECAPKLMYQIPLNARAAKVQAGVVTGLFFLIP